jgi:KaiC/GvpD/RAD55 family RecA-like ATPase
MKILKRIKSIFKTDEIIFKVGEIAIVRKDLSTKEMYKNIPSAKRDEGCNVIDEMISYAGKLVKIKKIKYYKYGLEHHKRYFLYISINNYDDTKWTDEMLVKIEDQKKAKEDYKLQQVADAL